MVILACAESVHKKVYLIFASKIKHGSQINGYLRIKNVIACTTLLAYEKQRSVMFCKKI